MTKFLKNIRESLLNQISFYKRAFDKKICVKNLNFLILIFELRTNEGFATFLSNLVVNSKRFEINYPMICLEGFISFRLEIAIVYPVAPQKAAERPGRPLSPQDGCEVHQRPAKRL